MAIENVIKKKKTSRLAKKGRKSHFGDKFIASPNELEKMSNVDASVCVFKTPMAPTKNQVNQVLDAHD